MYPEPQGSPNALPASKKMTALMPAGLMIGDSSSKLLTQIWVPPTTRRSSLAVGSSEPWKLER